MERDSGIIYASFYKAVQKLPAEQQAEAYNAYCEYVLYGIKYEGDNLAISVLLESFSDKIEAANARYQKKVENINRNSRNRRQPADEDMNSHEIVNENTKSYEIVNENTNSHEIAPVTVTDTVIDINNNSKEKDKRERFTKPTLDDVTAYCKERGNHVDPAMFMSFYESNGWKVGKNPMKDWKACVRTWENRDKTRAPVKPNNSFHNFDERKKPNDDSLNKLAMDKFNKMFEDDDG